jgi:hypothetical protein
MAAYRLTMPPQARLHELLDYDLNTGLFRWRTPPRGRQPADGIAGTISHGYRVISIDGVIYRCNRLAWLYVKGEPVPPQVDHRNLDTLDNGIENLRDATHSQNHANARPQRNNTSGFKGVSWNEPRRKWVAHIKVNGIQRNLGGFPTKEEASAAYEAAAIAAWGEFARV